MSFQRLFLTKSKQIHLFVKFHNYKRFNFTEAIPSQFHFPANQRWFEEANRIIFSHFENTTYLKNAIEKCKVNNKQNLMKQLVSEELLNASEMMQKRIGDKQNETILNILRF